MVLTRVAIYEGTINPADADAFFKDVHDRLEPIWRSFPHVLDVRILRVTQPDADARPTVMILEMDFPSMQAIEQSLNSDIKTKAHEEHLQPHTNLQINCS